MDLVIRVKEIEGTCPVFKEGDTFELQGGYKLVSKIPLCMHALASLLPHYNALRLTEPARWGLAGRKKGEEDRAYVQCLDAVAYTGGGTVTLEISQREERGDE